MADEERVTVRTYVPAFQREAWREDAEAMGMSQSEFVRTMVQAGRRDFELAGGSSNPAEADVPASTPGGEAGKEALDDRVLDALRDRGSLDWDGLVEELAGGFEDRLEDTLDDLQSANRVKYSGREGGYVVNDGR